MLRDIKSAVPAPAGGTLTADVVEYEMREAPRCTNTARMQLPAS